MSRHPLVRTAHKLPKSRQSQRTPKVQSISYSSWRVVNLMAHKQSYRVIIVRRYFDRILSTIRVAFVLSSLEALLPVVFFFFADCTFPCTPQRRVSLPVCPSIHLSVFVCFSKRYANYLMIWLWFLQALERQVSVWSSEAEFPRATKPKSIFLSSHFC